MLNRRLGAKALALVIVGLLLSTSLLSCGPEVTPTEPTEPPPVEEPTEPPPDEEPTEPPPTEPPEETSITIVIPEDPPSFNGTVTYTGYERMVQKLVLLGLAHVDPYGEVYPKLAAELPTVDNGGVVYDEDAWTMDVTWRLRDDVYWQDGEPVTADDVVFTFEAASDPDTGIWFPGADYLDSVEKVDDYTLIAHYSGIYPGYLTQFGGEGSLHIWPAHYCDPEQGFTAWDCNQEPLSNGPYILENWAHGDHLTFVRNPDYYEEGKPHIDRIIVRIVPDASVRQTMLERGDADFDFWITEKHVAEVEAMPNVDVSFSPSGRWIMRLIPNLAERGSIDPANPHPVLADVRVRQAIRQAIDVQTIIDEIWYGYPQQQWTKVREPYHCDISEPRYDPEGARALLEEAGWVDEDGDGTRECSGCLNAEDGYPLSIEFAIYAEYGEELELTQQLIAEMLSDVGFDIELAMIPGSVMWDTYDVGGLEQTGNFDLNMWDDGYIGIDPSDHLWYMYHSAAAEPDYGWNVMRWINEEADTMIDYSYTLDEEYRAELFCDFAELRSTELPQMLLFTTVDASAHSQRLEGVQATANDTHTWNVADWRVTE